MYLIDTHVIIWTLYQADELPQKVRNILLNEDCFYSIASLWELSIKKGLGKIKIDSSMREISNFLIEREIKERTITPEDCDIVKDLPQIHRDPFDRLIIAQALADDLTIVTKDGIIPKYDVKTVWD